MVWFNLYIEQKMLFRFKYFICFLQLYLPKRKMDSSVVLDFIMWIMNQIQQLLILSFDECIGNIRYLWGTYRIKTFLPHINCCSHSEYKKQIFSLFKDTTTNISLVIHFIRIWIIKYATGIYHTWINLKNAIITLHSNQLHLQSCPAGLIQLLFGIAAKLSAEN